MTAYYNEIDPYAAQWLRNLIKEGLIAPGEVDTRSIVDVRPGELVAFKQCHFFAGLGGWAGALRLAGFPDDRPVWTGSCPCQPFSLAGKQKGFADDRHLWPVWRELIAERRPAKVYGEQVASASEWLRLVRGDLEALDYAVGAEPIEAASAGADHLRDRYWFVGDHPSERRREGWAEHAVRSRRPAFASDGGLEHPAGERSWAGLRQGDAIQHWHGIASAGGLIDLGDAEHSGRERRQPEWSGADSALPPGEAGLADADQSGSREKWQQRSGQLGWPSRDPEACDWVIGADGKARRVKSGVRLLAHGVPARVAKLRALGNAIDLRPATAFIKATM